MLDVEIYACILVSIPVIAFHSAALLHRLMGAEMLSVSIVHCAFGYICEADQSRPKYWCLWRGERANNVENRKAFSIVVFPSHPTQRVALLKVDKLRDVHPTLRVKFAQSQVLFGLPCFVTFPKFEISSESISWASRLFFINLS